MNTLLVDTPSPKHAHQDLFVSSARFSDAVKKPRCSLSDRYIPKKLNFDTFVYRKCSD